MKKRSATQGRPNARVYDRPLSREQPGHESGDGGGRYGDGLQTRDFVHVADVVRANLMAARAKDAPGEIVNVGSGKSASLLELIALLREAVGPEAAHLEPLHQAPRAGDLRASSADLTKARKVLGYEPRVTLAAGLADLVSSWRAARVRAA